MRKKYKRGGCKTYQDGGTQKYNQGKGYGNAISNLDNTLDTHSWYFDNEDKKNAFKQAALREGSQKEVLDFQNAYNSEIVRRAKQSGMNESEITNLVNQTGFSNKGSQMLDGKFGNFTSTRPMYEPKVNPIEFNYESTPPNIPYQELPPQFVKPKSYRIEYEGQDMQGNNRYITNKANTIIENKAEKQGGLTYEQVLEAQRVAEANNAELERKYNNPEAQKNPKAQARFKQLQQKVNIIPEYAYGGETDPPKSTKGNEISAYPTTTYGENVPMLGQKANNNSQVKYELPGNLNLNPNFGKTIYSNTPPYLPTNTQNNTTNTQNNTTTQNNTRPTTKQDGSAFYKGMFSQPTYTPPNELGFTPKTQFGTTNYVSPISTNSLTSGQDWVKDNPLPQGIIPTELGLGTPSMDKYTKEKTTEENTEAVEKRQPYQFFNPYAGFDIPTAASTLGSSIESGDTLGTVASGLKLATGLGRNILGGMGQQRVQNRVMKNYFDNQREVATQENRTRVMEKGGYYQEGGQQEQIMQEVSQMLQQGVSPEEVVQALIQQGMTQEQAVALIQSVMQSQQPMMQEGGEMGQQEQVMQMVAQSLQEGAQPEEIMQMLMEQGIPQEQAIQMIEMVMQQIGGAQQPPAEQPMMKNGGEYLEMMKGKKIKNYTFNKDTNSYEVEFEE